MLLTLELRARPRVWPCLLRSVHLLARSHRLLLRGSCLRVLRGSPLCRPPLVSFYDSPETFGTYTAARLAGFPIGGPRCCHAALRGVPTRSWSYRFGFRGNFPVTARLI